MYAWLKVMLEQVRRSEISC